MWEGGRVRVGGESVVLTSGKHCSLVVVSLVILHRCLSSSQSPPQVLGSCGRENTSPTHSGLEGEAYLVRRKGSLRHC